MTARDAGPRAAFKKTVALALGGGGARALAHIVVLEALDDLGVSPVAIAGTSLGGLAGAAYAAGLSGREIRRHVLTLAHDRSEVLRRLFAARAATPLFAPLSSNPMLVDAEKFCAQFLPAAVPEDFGALRIPLTVVATDLYGRCETVFREGPLRPALAATMAIPGLVRPLESEGRILVDGGAINPLPFEHVRGLADVVLAVDMSSGAGRPEIGEIPDPLETLFTTLQVMGTAIVGEKLRHWRPDILLRPRVGAFRLLDFFHASAILRAAEPLRQEVKSALSVALG